MAISRTIFGFSICWNRLTAFWLFSLVFWAQCATPGTGAISVEPSQRWEGNDGPWSTFSLQVGTPAQNVRVLVGLGGQETWVVAPGGCIASDPSNCRDLRGGVFGLNASSTWVSTKSIWNNTGYYLLGNYIGRLLGINAPGEYGFDTVTLGYPLGNISVQRSIVASFIAKDYYLGQFGISPRSTNFTVTNDNSSALDDPQPSYLTLLKRQGTIPSLSWAYNAGSYARSATLQNAFGSLTLGGFDSTRFNASQSLTTAFGADDGRELLVAVNSIRATDGNERTTFIVTVGALAVLDSTQPFIWLPEQTCRQFESAYGLVWNASVGMYLLNDTQHSNLVALDPTLQFTLSRDTAGTGGIQISIPYSSLDLTVSSPIVAAPTRYYPLKRAANATQYTLGRAFLQETYLIADYERRNLTIAQALWSNGGGTASSLVPIAPLGNGTGSTAGANPADGKKKKTSNAVIIAVPIVCGVLALALLAGLLLFLLRRRRLRSKKDKATSPTDPPPTSTTAAATQQPDADADEAAAKLGPEPGELDAGADAKPRAELPEAGRAELPAPAEPGGAGVVVHELDASGPSNFNNRAGGDGGAVAGVGGGVGGTGAAGIAGAAEPAGENGGGGEGGAGSPVPGSVLPGAGTGSMGRLASPSPVSPPGPTVSPGAARVQTGDVVTRSSPVSPATATEGEGPVVRRRGSRFKEGFGELDGLRTRGGGDGHT